MRCYPESTNNRNVPKNVFLVVETEAMSGEITTTYYIGANGYLWKVTNWKSDQPYFATMSQVCKLTGDTEKMVNDRYHQWLDSREVTQ